MAEKIVAAGGIVTNEKGEILFMYRRGKWDLPKGKLDEGESIENCAVREVEEETGLRNIQLADLIGVTTHYYRERGTDMRKETYWYAMSFSGEQELVPQAEEDIHELKWVSVDELHLYLSQTFDNIVGIINRFLEKRKPAV